MKKWFAAPIFDDPIKTRSASLLNFVSLAYLSVVIFGFWGTIAVTDLSQATPSKIMQFALIRGVSLAIFPIIAQILMRRRQVKAASIIYIYGLWAAFLLLIVFNGGTRSPSFPNSIMLVLVAGLLLSARHAFLIMGGTIFVSAIALQLELQGRLPTPVAQLDLFSDWLSISIIFFISTILLYLFIKNLNEAMAEADEAHVALQQNSLLLEEKVAERTRIVESAREDAEQARQEAEAVRRLVEQQAWQATGLAQLSAKMRGEQALPQLAENIIEHLCHYVNAQLGALFVLQNDKLHLLGSYAYTRRQHAKNEFFLGDGLVGQAALEKQAIILTKPPADYLLVMDGLLTAVPTNIAIIPFLYENKVVGVVELAFLKEPTEQHIEFLESTMESIAITFSVAQSRLYYQMEKAS